MLHASSCVLRISFRKYILLFLFTHNDGILQVFDVHCFPGIFLSPRDIRITSVRDLLNIGYVLFTFDDIISLFSRNFNTDLCITYLFVT